MILGLLGHDIQYSLSPFIFQRISDLSHIPITYKLFDVEIDDIVNIVKDLKEGKIDGFNVTKPYKEVILKYCDVLDDTARKVGSVNTVFLKNNKVIGTNTDVLGLKYLFENASFKLIEPIYVFGNGGSAKAANYVLTNLGYSPVIVKRMSSQRHKISENEITYEMLDHHTGTVIQTTTVGLNMTDNILVDEKHLKNKYLIDLIYKPEITCHMNASKSSINGLKMLIVQALESFNVWCDSSPVNIETYAKIIEESVSNELYR